MNIDELPDDCLLYIFNLFCGFGTLLDCSEVCERWKHLVFRRLLSVKYLTDASRRNGYPASTIYFREDDRLEQIEIYKWFPNLKILDVSGSLDVDCFSKLPVKGLCLNLYYDTMVENINIPSIEMLAVPDFYDFFANDIQGPILEQLLVSNCNISKLSSYAKYFPNLKRLHLDNYIYAPSKDNFYTGPVLEKLEILEMGFHTFSEPGGYYGFSLADHCPTLKSAFHFIQTGQEIFVDDGIVNYFLEDLVIEFCCKREFKDWSVLRRILSKYPNLKHLAIRGEAEISDENIPELLKLLPRISLIDLSKSKEVTEKSSKYIDRYCRYRSVSLYYQNRAEITKKWPHLSTKRVFVGRGFDFMKYCFLIDYVDSPSLLDPDD
ncbi:uncharacterized protein LOC107361588 [Tetranychus urticae]|uniref:F-box domain-containing protein n=1 Tax=Tetranychus urticae TaxID=32264 RepID=T1K8A3_TETUR|nr:uncharacterized protein LOC107361588 [Tetranychus urticae]